MKTMYLKGMVVMMTAWMACSSCEKSKDDVVGEYTGDELPGEISGFGENEGTVNGQTFSLPDGIVFDGEIWGYDENVSYETHSAGDKSEQLFARLSARMEEVNTRSTIKANVTIGSGGLVTVLIPLKNTSSKKIDVEFPAGLIFESAGGQYQNGILLKKAKASVPTGGSTYYVVLHLYCGNASRHASDSSAKYLKPVVTDSPLLLYLCGLVKNKKINIEENQGLLDQINYIVMVIRLQQIVWKVTDNGQMPDQSDLDYIADL